MDKKKISYELKERLLLLCRELDISPNKLSLDSGMSRDYIRQMKDFASADFLRYIHRTYPSVNLIWLITGDGEMYYTNTENADVSLLIRMLADERDKNKELSERIHTLEEELANIKA